jgi:flagellar hook assembly protein FlgD
VVAFGDSAFMSLLDHDLMTEVYPVLAGDGYPLLTADISISGGGLEHSIVNWPNPFNPDKEVTTIGFVLPEDARVDIEVFSITGNLVRTLAERSRRNEGSSQADTWDGRNTGGQTVLPGTYFLRITADYSSGKTEEATRRVAVVR